MADDKSHTKVETLIIDKPSLDKDLKKISRLEDATRATANSYYQGPFGIAILFLAAAGISAITFLPEQPHLIVITVAAMLGGYMALNIGANDVANNVGPTVGSKALTMFGALIIAAIFESAGAIFAGGDVISTIAQDIIDPSLVPNSQTFIWAMMAALLASALWVNLATYLRAPVSTTHSIVGGVMGGGIAALGLGAVNWFTMTKIMSSWIISPFLGGVIAALILAFIKSFIMYRENKIKAAQRWLPILIAIMAASFSSYLMIKGLNKIWQPTNTEIIVYSFTIFFLTCTIMHPTIRHQSKDLSNRNQSLRKLFHIPLICSAALLSFAHGANDVANAIGPVAAILHAVQYDNISTSVLIPTWVMFIGAFGISLGLLLFGPKLIRTVGQQITRINPMRAFSIALATAITVIIASALGLPVSSTHIAIGAVFGVGFFREYFISNSKRRKRFIKKHPNNKESAVQFDIAKKEIQRRKLVRRSHFIVIVTAWIVTVPASATLSAIIFYILDNFAYY